MGSVDFKVLPWELFLYGVFIFLGLGSVFCLGFMRIFQGRVRMGVTLMSVSAVVFFVSYYFVSRWYSL